MAMNVARTRKVSRGASGRNLLEQNKGAGYRVCQVLELLLVIFLIILSWGLMALPTVFFYIDPEQSPPSDPGKSNMSTFEDANSTLQGIANMMDPEAQLVQADMLFNCSEGFYREEGSTFCIASCYAWRQYDNVTTLVVDIIIMLGAVVGFIASITVLILSCLERKRMLKFPSIFVVYMVVDALVFGIILIVSYSYRFGLYCSARSIIESSQNVTPFCVVTGMVFTYIIFQMVVWWVLHTVMLFWRIIFPFKAKSYLDSTKQKWIHLACLLVGLILPLATVITSVSKFAVDSRRRALNGTSALDSFVSGGLGYFNPRFPPAICIPSDKNAAFYSLILPMSVGIAIGSNLLVTIIWRIHRQSLSRVILIPRRFRIGTAEKKLLVVFCYFTILCSLALTTLTLRTRYGTNYSQSLLKYFQCELGGYNPEQTCSKSEIRRYSYPIIGAISFLVIGIYPVMTLIFALNVQNLRDLCSKKKPGLSAIDTRQSLFSMSNKMSNVSYDLK